MKLFVLKKIGHWVIRKLLRKGAEEVIEHLDETRLEPQSVDGYSMPLKMAKSQKNRKRRKRKAAKRARKAA